MAHDQDALFPPGRAAVFNNTKPDPKKKKGIWQRRFWEHRIRDEADLETHLDYIHFNPVKHGHCDRVIDWPHSTFHRWVAKGHYPADWGISELTFQGRFGE